MVTRVSPFPAGKMSQSPGVNGCGKLPPALQVTVGFTNLQLQGLSHERRSRITSTKVVERRWYRPTRHAELHGLGGNGTGLEYHRWDRHIARFWSGSLRQTKYE